LLGARWPLSLLGQIEDDPQCAAFVDRADMQSDPCAYDVLVGRELVPRFPDVLSGMLDVDYGHQRLVLQQLCASIDEVAAAVRLPDQLLSVEHTVRRCRSMHLDPEALAIVARHYVAPLQQHAVARALLAGVLAQVQQTHDMRRTRADAASRSRARNA